MFTGIVGCQAALGLVDLKKQTTYSHSWKGVKKVYNISFHMNGSIRTWMAYSVGEGTKLSKDGFSRMTSLSQTDTGQTIIDEFTEPIMQGNVKHHALMSSIDTETEVQEELEPITAIETLNQNLEVLYCAEEGCTKCFQTFSGFSEQNVDI